MNFEDWGLARELTEENVVRARALGSRYLENELIGMLGDLEAHDGNIERALELARQHVELSRELGFTWFEAGALVTIAKFSLKLGRTDDVEAYALAALELLRLLEDRRVGSFALALAAAGAQARGDDLHAGHLWGAVETELARIAPDARWRKYFDEIRELGLPRASPVFDAGVAAGRSLTWEDAVESVLAGRNEAESGSGEVST
jgi:hypothetical protein